MTDHKITVYIAGNSRAMKMMEQIAGLENAGPEKWRASVREMLQIMTLFKRK